MEIWAGLIKTSIIGLLIQTNKIKVIINKLITVSMVLINHQTLMIIIIIIHKNHDYYDYNLVRIVGLTPTRLMLSRVLTFFFIKCCVEFRYWSRSEASAKKSTQVGFVLNNKIKRNKTICYLLVQIKY